MELKTRSFLYTSQVRCSTMLGHFFKLRVQGNSAEGAKSNFRGNREWAAWAHCVPDRLVTGRPAETKWRVQGGRERRYAAWNRGDPPWRSPGTQNHPERQQRAARVHYDTRFALSSGYEFSCGHVA